MRSSSRTRAVRFKSEGAWRMLDDDGRDGVDTCAWISRRPWSDGQVGMFGFSYHAGTQHVAALARPPELKTVVLVDAMASPGHRGIRYGGAFELRFFNWIFDQAARRLDGVTGPRHRRNASRAPRPACRVSRSSAAGAGSDAAASRPGVRELDRRGPVTRRRRCVLGSGRRPGPRARVQGHPGLPDWRLVRLLGRWHDRNLPDAP